MRRSLARAITGTLTFNGAGGYSIDGQLADNAAGNVQTSPFHAEGKYSVASSGMAEIENPLDRTQTIRAGVGARPVVAGSSTEGDFHDIFIAIPVGGDVNSNSAIQGDWEAGYVDFPQGKSALVRSALFAMSADGQGGLGSITANGNALNLGSGPVSQTVTLGTYSLASKGAGTITFPAGGAAEQNLIGGEKVLFVSADRRILLGGAPAGFDVLVGMRAAANASNAMFQGTYFMAGMSDDGTDFLVGGLNHLFFFSGSVSANGQYTSVWHERINPAATPSYDLTLAGGINFAADGTMTSANARTAIGSDGQAFIDTGNGSMYRFTFGVKTLPAQADGVWLDPAGVVNAANFAPVTNPVAPGELVTLFGSGMASGTVAAQGTPLPLSLAGVQVTVNGKPAPLVFVSPGQISAVVPFSTTAKYATFRVINNGAASNPVTVYTNLLAPGVFAMGSGGTGPAAMLHSDFSLVSEASPAVPGESVMVFVTGLGAVTPAQPLSHAAAEKQMIVFIGGKPAVVSFAGLAPGFAGLYQINCTIPDGVGPGDVYFDIDGVPAGYTSLATVRIGR